MYDESMLNTSDLIYLGWTKTVAPLALAHDRVGTTNAKSPRKKNYEPECYLKYGLIMKYFKASSAFLTNIRDRRPLSISVGIMISHLCAVWPLSQFDGCFVFRIRNLLNHVRRIRVHAFELHASAIKVMPDAFPSAILAHRSQYELPVFRIKHNIMRHFPAFTTS